MMRCWWNEITKRWRHPHHYKTTQEGETQCGGEIGRFVDWEGEDDCSKWGQNEMRMRWEWGHKMRSYMRRRWTTAELRSHTPPISLTTTPSSSSDWKKGGERWMNDEDHMKITSSHLDGYFLHLIHHPLKLIQLLKSNDQYHHPPTINNSFMCMLIK